MAEGWHVTGTAPTYLTDGTGRNVEVVRVDFTTDAGSRGHVDIPFAEFTADAARRLIEPLAAELIAVEKL